MKKYSVALLILVGISARAMHTPKYYGLEAKMGQPCVAGKGRRIHRDLIKHASTKPFVWVHMPTATKIARALGKAKKGTENKHNLKSKICSRFLPQKTGSKESPEEVFIKCFMPNGRDWHKVSPKQIIDLFLKKSFGQEFFEQYNKRAPFVTGGFNDLKYFFNHLVPLNEEFYVTRMDGITPIPNIMISSKGVISAQERAKVIYDLAEVCGYKTVRDN